jgi:hemoglobin
MKTRQPVAFALFVLVALVTGARAEDTLYRDLGGRAGIAKIANRTIDFSLADDRIKHAFDDSNIERIRLMLSDQLCEVAGGPCVYKGHSMTEAHRGLHLHDRDFNAIVEDLQKAMDEAAIPFPVQNRLVARLAPMEHQVVTR